MKCTRPPGPLDCHSCHSPNSPKLRRYSSQGEVAGAAEADVQQAGQAELAGAAEQGGDMAAGARVEDADGGGAGADDGAAAEQQGDGVNQRLGELGEVGVGDLADLAVVPVGGAEQDSRGRVAVGDALDLHGYDYDTRRETMSSTNVFETRIYRYGSRAAARAMEGLLHGYQNPMDSPLGLA